MNTIPHPGTRKRSKRKSWEPQIQNDVTCYPGSDRISVIVKLAPTVVDHCQRLLDTGLYGISIEGTIERLLCEQLRRILRESREN